MLIDDNHQNPSVCCFLVQIRAVAVFARIKKWSIVPGPIHQNTSLLSQPPRKSYRIGLLFTHKNGCGGAIFVTQRNYALPISRGECGAHTIPAIAFRGATKSYSRYSMKITLANHKRQDFFSNLVSCLITRKQYVNLISSVFDAKNWHQLNISTALSKMVTNHIRPSKYAEIVYTVFSSCKSTLNNLLDSWY